jgi:hypothetical protein
MYVKKNKELFTLCLHRMLQGDLQLLTSFSITDLYFSFNCITEMISYSHSVKYCIKNQ